MTKKKLTIEGLQTAWDSKICQDWLKEMYASRPVPWVGFWGTEEEWDDFCKAVIHWVDKHKARLAYIRKHKK